MVIRAFKKCIRTLSEPRESNFSGDHLLSRTAVVWCLVACVWGNILWNVVIFRNKGCGGRKGFDNLFVRFYRAFCGAVLKTGFLDDISFWFSFASLSVGLVVISFMLPMSSACSVGEPCWLWTIWVQWLDTNGGSYPFVAFIFPGRCNPTSSHPRQVPLVLFYPSPTWWEKLVYLACL